MVKYEGAGGGGEGGRKLGDGEEGGNGGRGVSKEGIEMEKVGKWKKTERENRIRGKEGFHGELTSSVLVSFDDNDDDDDDDDEKYNSNRDDRSPAGNAIQSPHDVNNDNESEADVPEENNSNNNNNNNSNNNNEDPILDASILLAVKTPFGPRFQRSFRLSDTLSLIWKAILREFPNMEPPSMSLSLEPSSMLSSKKKPPALSSFTPVFKTSEVPARELRNLKWTLAQCRLTDRSLLHLDLEK